MSLGRIKVNTTFLAIAAVTSRIFTASKDTYVDVLDNLDGTGTLVYTEVTNNAASPALAANSTRIAIIVTGATTIATTGSINQGQENKRLPIASSIAYTTTDSLGNLICPRDPNRSILGLKQIDNNTTNGTSTAGTITGLSTPVLIPSGRKAEVILAASAAYNLTNSAQIRLGLWDGAVGSGTFIGAGIHGGSASVGVQVAGGRVAEVIATLSAGLHTINPSLKTNGTGTCTLEGATASDAASIQPATLLVKLV